MISAFATTASTIVPRNPQSVGCEVQLHCSSSGRGLQDNRMAREGGASRLGR
jgi:hypothetical protein